MKRLTNTHAGGSCFTGALALGVIVVMSSCTSTTAQLSGRPRYAVQVGDDRGWRG